VTFVLGQTDSWAEATRLARQYRDRERADAAFDAMHGWWARQLEVLRVETDRPDFDRLVNTWLPYQVLTARLWARTGAQQRGGAFGFRDQLQDVLPLCFTHPELARAQILLHAAQQFLEGDAVHWWHPIGGDLTGVATRTAASDPLLWLPFVVVRYLHATGDEDVLHETVPFLEGRPLPRGAKGILLVPRRSRDIGTLYEHCRRAVEWSLARRGARGLPLIGSGDWNDGLDALGAKGRGESVWVGFFLHAILRDFAPIAGRIEGKEAERRYDVEAERLRHALSSMWRDDGYVRATTDDNDELLVTSALMASWPALSGAVDVDRAREALEIASRHLEKDTRVLLLSPPFDERSEPYPGRIAEYPPGVRENGGQYSHGASWIVDAWLRCADLEAARGEETQAARCRARAWKVWLAISPLTKTSLDYGLPPHQQPADVYEGEGHGGRGGWSWYTGAAARMLWAAYALLGIALESGELRVSPVAPAEGGAPKLERLVYRGRSVALARS
jgi:cyclic beta-1,2-glucan synthetase